MLCTIPTDDNGGGCGGSRGLDLAARTFCSSETEVLLLGGGERIVRLNKILMWYGKDFERFAKEKDAGKGEDRGDRTKAEAGVLQFVCQNLERERETGDGDAADDDRAVILRDWLDRGVAFRVEYRDYDWGSNSK